jgi:hypothetical protein
MDEPEYKFDLPKKIERFFAALSKLYAQQANQQLLEIIVNSTIRVDEGADYDNWNNGTYGHIVHLTISEALFLSVMKERDKLQSRICADLEGMHNEMNEQFSGVVFEIGEAEHEDWREVSGVLATPQKTVSEKSETRIWEVGKCRVFLSHKAECKIEVAALKTLLCDRFGLTCFVAHEDIEPTKPWQDEIENALFSMDVLVALMTDKFHDSLWTDQEIGVAMGRNIPIVSVRLGKDPYGFIGKFQGVSGKLDDPDFTAHEIFKALRSHKNLSDQLKRSVITSLATSPSYMDSINRVGRLGAFDSLSNSEVESIQSIFPKNDQLHESFSARSDLCNHLKRMTGREFKVDGKSLVEAVDF